MTNGTYQDDDDDDFYSSSRKTFYWFDNLLSNTTANTEGQLTPAQDVNPDNVLATLLLNSIVCVFLLGLYEILRRYIPSVYSQRLVYGGRSMEDTPNVEGQMSPRTTRMAALSSMNASGTLGVSRSEDVTDAGKHNDKKKSSSCRCIRQIPILEWARPIHCTPWATYRDLAGLDAYFFLRYIRMCLKITAVSSFWAALILWPVYATGGGGQSGFYHFSMANVSPGEKGRVWVPTFFCWAFTVYCWFCVRREMDHYMELRMHFLGGEEEARIFGVASSRREFMEATGANGKLKIVDETPEEKNIENAMSENEDNRIESEYRLQPSEVRSVSPRSSSPLIPEHEEDTSPPNLSCHSFGENCGVYEDPNVEVKQHRYSLQVEKVPVPLRSNTALFNYFNEMFPNQVHSVCVAMNVPDLEALSVRRLRVARRLEKSLAYYYVTGTRPTHITGRPRFQCCGIESTPIDGMCLVCCCCYDSCQMGGAHGDDDTECPEEVKDQLPDKGECVDSISYYTLDLALCNIRLKKMQQEKFQIAETGLSMRRSDRYGKKSNEHDFEWYNMPLGWAKTGAAKAAEGIRDEFEVLNEEDELFREKELKEYGTLTGQTLEKRAPLVQEDHLVDSDAKASSSEPSGVFQEGASRMEPPSSPRRRFSRPHMWMRALLWRMGFDFLAAGLDEVRDRTDVVVDSVTRPSMSSTGFVTFKTITPVTVSTSAPLTYNGIPIEVFVAPETRDIVWKNIQIDRDISAGREFVANVLLGLGVLLWSIPLTLIQAWAKVENVAKIPGLDWIADIHGGTYKPLINGYLPVITLLGLILLLPIIFKWVAEAYEKRKTFSGVEDSIANRYFYYQLANIYITVTAGALWTSLAEIIDHPQQLLLILGETLPKLAGYFISLLITKTLAGLPMVLLRIGALSRMMFLRSCFNKRRLTQRELNEVYRKQPILYGWEYPTQFLVITICFTYACITPIILPVGAIYFFFALLVYKKQALYVYTPTYDSGGSLFPQSVSKTLFALLISQMTFIGYTLIRKGGLQILFLSPLPFLTVFFTHYINTRYVKPSTKLSLERAVKIDARSDESHRFSSEAYQQPVLTEKALVPMPYRLGDKDDKMLTEVMDKLRKIQNESRPEFV
ncbi:hypothetical protein ACHAW6_007069 [Cyclotella cf. meneghiniana]